MRGPQVDLSCGVIEEDDVPVVLEIVKELGVM